MEEFLHTVGYHGDLDPAFGQAYPPQDGRLAEAVRHTHTRFTWQPYRSVASWEARRRDLRDRILLAAGLLPMPEKCPLNPRVLDLREFADYAVGKLTIESYPGFLVTGNIFLPKGKTGPFPAILNPHGHWEDGRLQTGDETDIPARCANFAKMGFVAVSYDMIGFQDSRQVAHSFGAGPECELWGVSGLGLQLWNSIRLLDYLGSREDVDASRIGCTGASGGGTQTFLLAAVDPRVAASAPVNMVSMVMQGGCSCENAPLLRIGTHNVELAALTAPRPMMLIGSTGDWTSELEQADYPAIRSVYALYGKEHRLESYFREGGHDYNASARKRVYNFFSRHLLGVDSPWEEQAVSLPPDSLRIYADGKTSKDLADNRAVFEIIRQSRAAAAGRGEKVELLRALALVTGVREKDLREFEPWETAISEGKLVQGFIGGEEERIPFGLIKKDGANRVILAVHPGGKWDGLECAMKREGRDGRDLASIDLFLTGDYAQPCAQAGRNVSDARYFTTFNPADAAFRIQDIVDAARFFSRTYDDVEIWGFGAAAILCEVAAPFLPRLLQRAFDRPVETDDRWLIEHMFLPCFQSIGGLEALKRL